MSSMSDRLLALGMPFLVLTGMFLPHAAAALQDRGQAQQTNSRPLGGIELSLRNNASAAVALDVLSKSTAKIILQEGTNLTSQDALACSEKAYGLLKKDGLLSDIEQGVMTAWAFLAVTNAGSGDTAVVWSCAWTNSSDAQCTILIDDATGKMVGIRIFTNTFITAVSEDADEQLQARAEQWAEFCKGYYGFQEAEIKAEYNDGVNGRFQLELSSVEGDNRISIKLPLDFRDDEISFNQ